MTSLRGWLKAITPPVVWRGLRAVRDHFATHEYEYVAPTWPMIGGESARFRGWNAAGVLKAYQAGWPEFVRGLNGYRALERAPNALAGSTGDPVYHNFVVCYGYVLARTAWKHTAISMLDWGGGLGHYRLISQALMPELAIDYHCKDLPLLASEGQKMFPDAHFYTDERCLERTYNLVLASHSLYYAENWPDTLAKLAAATSGYLYVAGLPTVEKAPSFVFVQRPYRYGYNTEYLGWCVNKNELLATSQAAGLRLLREFAFSYQLDIFGAPEQCTYGGYLFAPGRGE